MKKLFTCAKCDENIAVEDIWNNDRVSCHGCGREYRVVYVEREKSWELLPVDPVEERERDLAEQAGERPFEVLREPAGLRKDDTEKL
jgi:DNA-directed RNA polymerase subunit RPC12/RpoP